jgi:hypothetical protein
MKEEFRNIKGYEGLYQISNLGKVKSLKRKLSDGRKLKEKILKPQTNNCGYLRVNLYKYRKMKSFLIHQLMAMAFLNHIPNGHKSVVDHIDNDKNNNRLENLQIITSRHNLSKDKKGGSSEYTGVSWSKATSKWRSQLTVQGKVLHLGYFEFELDAAEAYQKALKVILANPKVTYEQMKALRKKGFFL